MSLVLRNGPVRRGTGLVRLVQSTCPGRLFRDHSSTLSMTVDEEIKLPEDTLKILQEFLKEKAEREVQEDTEQGDDIGTFEENWQLSQFWYDNETKQSLATVCSRIIANEGWDLQNTRIGLLSCPSLFTGIRDLGAQTRIFEYDERFRKYGEGFVFYDYTEAFNEGVLDEYKGFFDIIIADPPFLAEECIEKVSRIVKKFAKVNAKVVLCSGQVVKEWCKKHMDLNECTFVPKHQRNLANQFASYANFDLDSLLTPEPTV